MAAKIKALLFDNGSRIEVGQNVAGGAVAKIIDRSVEYPDALHRIYHAYTDNNKLIASVEDCRLVVLYEEEQNKADNRSATN